MYKIIGQLNQRTNVSRSEIERMLNIDARGLDRQSEISIEGCIGFGLRLSGCQIVKSTFKTKRFIAFILGKIYNAKILAEQIGFKTEVDTEAIEELFEAYGVELFRKLNGEFALIIWDRLEKKLFLVTDRQCTRDIFYFFNGSQFIFSTDIKSMLKSTFVNAGFNYNVLKEFMFFRYIASNETLFKNIFKLLQGQYLEYSQKDGLKLKIYWDIVFNEDDSISEQECLEQMEDKLKKSIALKTMGDDKIGLTLSGGVDSSLIACNLALLNGKEIHTCCVGSRNPIYDENRYASIVVQKIKSIHMYKNMEDFDFRGDLERLTWIFEEPTRFYNSLALYKLFQDVDKNVKIMLSGNGPCVFGTPEELLLQKLMKFKLMPAAIKRNLFRLPIPKLNERFGELSNFYRLQPRNYILLMLDIPSLQFSYDKATVEELLNEKINPEKDFKNIYNLYDSCSSEKLGDRYIYILRKSFNTAIVKKMVKLSYTRGLESREPLLDNDLVELAYTLPQRIKNGRNCKKFLIKKLLESYMSKEFVHRKKMGLLVPLKDWLNDYTKLGSYINILEEKSTLNRGIFNSKAIKNLLGQHRNGVYDYHRVIWLLLGLEIWFRIFIDKTIKVES